jgi:hypothetical protein
MSWIVLYLICCSEFDTDELNGYPAKKEEEDTL